MHRLPFRIYAREESSATPRAGHPRIDRGCSPVFSFGHKNGIHDFRIMLRYAVAR